MRDIASSPMVMHLNRRSFVVGAGAAALVTASAVPALAAKPAFWSNNFGYVIRGYDPVAYFDQGEPVEGLTDHEIEWNGASWRFSTAERKERFLAETTKYAPQFGGYCSWAMAQGRLASVVPEAWDIVDDKLYMNFSLDVREKWRSNISGHIEKAEGYYPEILSI